MQTMYLAYFDESGDSGITNSPTEWFVLNAILIHETVWLDTLDSVIMMRRGLRDRYGIPPRPELKGTDIRKGKGAFGGLGLTPNPPKDVLGDSP